MTKLKPCPFCGGKARLEISGRDDPRYDNSSAMAICDTCCANIEMSPSKKQDEVIEKWNRRVKE